MMAVVVLPDILTIVAIGSHKFNVTHWIRLIVGDMHSFSAVSPPGEQHR
jgi:hypothetical protein